MIQLMGCASVEFECLAFRGLWRVQGFCASWQKEIVGNEDRRSRSISGGWFSFEDGGVAQRSDP